MIMVEAYKKNILVNLIIHGKKPTLSKFTSPVVNQYLKVRCHRHYDDDYYLVSRVRPILVRSGNVLTKCRYKFVAMAKAKDIAVSGSL